VLGRFEPAAGRLVIDQSSVSVRQPVRGDAASRGAPLPEGALYYCAPRAYLRATLAVARSYRKGEYVVIALRSGRFMRTDVLGAVAVRSLMDGRSGAETMAMIEHLEAGAGERARWLICMLGGKGAMTFWPPARSRLQAGLRRLVSSSAGLAMNAAIRVAGVMPIVILVRLYRMAPRRLVAASSNGLFLFLSLIVTPERLNRLACRLFDRSSVQELAERLKTSDTSIAVFLHGELCAALPNALHAVHREIVRAIEPWQHGVSVSATSDKQPRFFGETAEMCVDVANPLGTASLLRHLKTRHTVYLGLDTWSKRSEGVVEVLGHAFPRNDGPAWLAVRSGCPVSLWTTYASHSGVVIKTYPAIHPDPRMLVPERVVDVSNRLYADADAAIRAHPEAWLGSETPGWLTNRNVADTYNYRSFSFDELEPEVACWLEFGPHIGSIAPDFALDDLSGGTVQLARLRGRPVVVEFASYSDALFPDQVVQMERLAGEHPDVEFLVIAVREAHPGETSPAHESMTQKRNAARRLAVDEQLRRRVLIDDLGGTVHRAYGGTWNSVYVIDGDGRVAYRRAWNRAHDVAAALDLLLAGKSPSQDESIDMPEALTRPSIAVRLLSRGGQKALVDFYSSAPQGVRRALRVGAPTIMLAAPRDATR
jgi:peroxiredoxin